MTDLLKTLSFAALVAIAAPAFAQDADTTGTADTTETTGAADAEGTAVEAPETGEEAGQATPAPTGDEALSMGEPAETQEAGPGSTYIEAEFGDWQQRCVRAPDGNDPCQMYQLLRDGDGNAVAEMSVFPLPPGREAAAGATIITPLETLLTQAITLSVDGNQPKRYPFEFCTQQGCISRVGFTQAEVDQFRRGAAGRMVLVPAAAPDQQIDLTISLSGFTAGYQAVTEANAEAVQAAPE